MGCLRIEKSFPSWGRELSPDFTPFEAGLGRFVKLDKAAFVGRDAALRLKQQLLVQRLSTLSIDAEDADAWGGEPVLRDGEYVGFVTSASYGHTVGQSLALAYLTHESIEPDGEFRVEIIGEARTARILPRAPFDPTGARMRS